MSDTLSRQLLIAMPGLPDDRFANSVVLICTHSAEGAMGLIINKTAPQLTFEALADQLELPLAKGTATPDIAIHYGGPVEPGRGFVLHSSDYFIKGASAKVANGVCLTANIEILRAISAGDGPADALLALGYASWAPGQLEAEIQSNSWLHNEANRELVFGTDISERYTVAMTQLGVDPSFLVAEGGTA